MRIVVTGASGLLGPYLLAAGAAHGTPIGLSRTGDVPCDLADAGAVRATLAQLQPDLVVHAAGYTDVDGCERDPERAELANHLAAANIVSALAPSATLVHISTDQVYPDHGAPHREGNEAPVNAYGRSKLAGERAALAHPATAVLRTNFFGASRTAGRTSLSDFVTNSLRAGRPTPLFVDTWFSPLHMQTLADLVFEVAQRGLRGVFNAGSRDGVSKRDFGHLVAQHLCLSTATAQDTSFRAAPHRAPRPADLRMDVARLEAALGRSLPTLAAEVRHL